MISFVTGNQGKVREASDYLPVPIEQVEYDYTEIQAADVEAVAVRGAREAFGALGGEEPALVEDSGLFVDALDGFPGPYSAYIEDTLGIERVYRLVAPEENPRAAFRSVVAYATDDPVDALSAEYDGRRRVLDGVTVVTFSGSVRGEIVAPRGDGGFGYDPIFEYDGRTFAELTTAEKNAISHRGRALEKLGDWLAVQET